MRCFCIAWKHIFKTSSVHFPDNGKTYSRIRQKKKVLFMNEGTAPLWASKSFKTQISCKSIEEVKSVSRSAPMEPSCDRESVILK